LLLLRVTHLIATFRNCTHRPWAHLKNWTGQAANSGVARASRRWRRSRRIDVARASCSWTARSPAPMLASMRSRCPCRSVLLVRFLRCAHRPSQSHHALATPAALIQGSVCFQPCPRAQHTPDNHPVPFASSASRRLATP
jgi:hypothetical protein